jgi:hypothetical protein
MKKTVVVAGYLVRYPLGGHVLSVLHWLVGLQRLGYDVVFIEHFGWLDSCYDPRSNTMSDDPAYGIAEMRQNFARFGLEKWCYVDASGNFHGMSREEVMETCRRANLMLSLWGVTWLDEFAKCSNRVFIDTDPGFTQFGMPPTPAPSLAGYGSPYDFHYHFTYGARIGQPDCPIPTRGLRWRPTRPPVVLDLLPSRFTPEAELFTTVMSWSSRQPIVYEAVEYGQKDIEFWRVIDLPQRAGHIFEIALAGASAPRAQITAAGWRIADTREITATPWTYRDYIGQSRGEFSVAVNLEVKTRSGWFSDRTAAYLASGKPVIVQETGFSELLPCGAGLFAFETVDDAAAAVEVIAADYKLHCEAARHIAEEYFDSDKVLGAILREIEA